MHAATLFVPSLMVVMLDDDELYARLPNVDAGVFRASKAAGSHEYIAQHGKRVGDAMGDTVHATHGQQICTTSQTEGDATKR